MDADPSSFFQFRGMGPQAGISAHEFSLVQVLIGVLAFLALHAFGAFGGFPCSNRDERDDLRRMRRCASAEQVPALGLAKSEFETRSLEEVTYALPFRCRARNGAHGQLEYRSFEMNFTTGRRWRSERR